MAIFNPISSPSAAGRGDCIQSFRAHLVDFLKTRGVTPVFKSCSIDHPQQTGEFCSSSQAAKMLALDLSPSDITVGGSAEPGAEQQTRSYRYA